VTELAAAGADVPDLLRDHVNRAMARVLKLLGAPQELSSAGSVVTAADGARYLDCGGYGVFLHGHCHPVVVEAVVEQVRRHPLATHALFEPTIARAARDLSAIAPDRLDYVFFTNSGAEAVELGLKVARANGRRRVISTQRGYHGKTTGALSVTGKAGYREQFLPLLPLVEFVDYGDAAAMERALAAGGPAAVIVEPIQGEGGVRIPPPGYLRAVRGLCDRHGGLLLMDEVQTGLGRTGRMWGCDAEGVVPDVLLVGKILSGGVIPVGAMVTSAELYEPFNRDPLLHSSTFGGSPVAAAAASAAIAVLRDEDLVGRSATLGRRLLGLIGAVAAEHGRGIVGEVRGRGLLIGLEFTSASLAADVMSELLSRRVLTSYTLNSHEVLRLTPPATLTEEEIDWLVRALREACREVNTRFMAREGSTSAAIHYARPRSVDQRERRL
jgi:putrescine aminotransferase